MVAEIANEIVELINDEENVFGAAMMAEQI
jgi:hypothetical protein